ncbi:type I glyceraldehyde-3-phosphate dehydrogenase [Leuconostoc pseudomesenteroides]|uniref:type I glyceraldehyde-3-phosphate dehydrogenase n=1 Tax=Leuconostoc pseudomesenteroides TaxID=33968 RepID=UPI0032DEF74C
MSVKVGINGFGRIGRLAFRRILSLAESADDIEVVAINDLTSPAILAYLLKHDSTHGKLKAEVSADETGIIVNGKHYNVYAEQDARQIPWVQNDGVNQNILTPDDKIISAGSCTTQSLAPMAYVLQKEFGIEVGTMTTIHAFTSTQMILDGPKGSNLRSNRTASANTIPHSTGAAKAIGLVIPELQGKLQGHAQRVAVVDGSVTELVSILSRHVTAEEINNTMKKYQSESFGYDDDEIVSSDMIGDTHGGVFDPTQTEITTAGDFQLVKTVTWYDNEYGFTSNMIRTLQYFTSL